MGIGFLEDLALQHRLDLLLLVYVVPAINLIPTTVAFISVTYGTRPTDRSPFAYRAARWWFTVQLASGLVALVYDLYSWWSVQTRWTAALRELTGEEMLNGSEIAEAANELFYVHFFGLVVCLIPILGAVFRAVALHRHVSGSGPVRSAAQL
ncbi:MAG: hypothetical protein EHM23_31985 [Acidobacteria bacterium]|nr:MAG: hypothetical protein EHM23_31985 [Acidobacteriota bacterium]